jgi:putative toxin-antitoxin system antitoxin component (TIGR02293 family)
MDSSKPLTRWAKTAAVSPTEYLLRSDSGQLSPIAVYKLIAKGFDLEDVQEMLSISTLYLERNILSRIVGKSLRTIHRLDSSKQPIRLNSQQSAVAFQYARALERAINVFGTQTLAEEWLGRPCKYMEGEAPLDVIYNAVGFQTVEEYLQRIEYGLYQ